MATMIVGPRASAPTLRVIGSCLRETAKQASGLLFSHHPAPKLPTVYPAPAFLASPKMFGNNSYFRLRQPGQKDLFSKRRADVL
jgi:hypothetical protein